MAVSKADVSMMLNKPTNLEEPMNDTVLASVDNKGNDFNFEGFQGFGGSISPSVVSSERYIDRKFEQYTLHNKHMETPRKDRTESHTSEGVCSSTGRHCCCHDSILYLQRELESKQRIIERLLSLLEKKDAILNTSEKKSHQVSHNANIVNQSQNSSHVTMETSNASREDDDNTVTKTKYISDNDALNITNNNEVGIQQQLKTVREQLQEKYKNNIRDNNIKYNLPSENDRDGVQDKSHWPAGTTLIVGDSMLLDVDEKRLSKHKMKVRSFPGAKVDDMYDYVKPLLKKKPQNVIIHVGTNNTVGESSRLILDQILAFKHFVESSLREDSKVVISTVVQRSDNPKATMAVNLLNNHLKDLAIDLVDNDNIDGTCLGKKGLHLNSKGSGKLAVNFIKKVRSINSN